MKQLCTASMHFNSSDAVVMSQLNVSLCVNLPCFSTQELLNNLGL